MTFIHRVFLVDFHEPVLLVVDFLPEPKRRFAGIDFLA
jgi:hypothetical protein